MALPFNITPQSVLSNAGALLGILNTLPGVDVVGIFDSNSFRQLFTDARPLKAFVRPGSKVMDHPVETGAVLSDHQIILPVQIELSLVIPAEFYSSTYQQIRSAQINAQKLTVQTKTGVYSNMIIQELPHQESPDMYSSIAMGLRLREVLFVVPSSIGQPNAPANYSPTDPQNQSIVSRGQQSPLSISLPSAALGYLNAAYAWGR